MGASRLYRTGHKYPGQDLRTLDCVQSADLMYFAHLDYAPYKLTRASHVSWQFENVAFGPTLAAPIGVAAVATTQNRDNKNPDGSTKDNSQFYTATKKYVVAAVNENGQISRTSGEASAVNDLSLAGNFNTLSWAALPGAEYYVLFASEGDTSSYGYIGRSETTKFVDGFVGGNTAIAPDYADGPRIGENPFDGPGNYPSTVTFHQQRLMWARTRNAPNAVFGSQSADFENMDISRPVKPDDALTFGLVADRVNAVNELVSLRSLLALTSDGVFSVTGGGEGSALTPTQIVSDRQIGHGVCRLSPLVVDTVAFYRPNQGSTVRTLGYTFELDGFRSNDVSIFSPHLFDGYGLIAWAHQREPYSVLWAVRSDGKLLAMTWEQEQQVWGWTVCEMDGKVEDVAVITEGRMDRVYLAVRRTLNGVEKVFVERMALPLLVEDDLVDCCYLDCAVSQRFNPPRSSIGRLFHLEGETVTAFADGYVVENLVVEGAHVRLGFEASTVTVGLPYKGEIETLPLALAAKEGSAHVNRQLLGTATLRVEKTRGLKVGVGDQIYEIKQREDEALDEPIRLATRDYEVRLPAKWSADATMRVVQDQPLPASISALFPDVKVSRE